MPINQVSQQLNSIVMALAGAERIFRICWMKNRRLDEGYVTLVNAENENGEVRGEHRNIPVTGHGNITTRRIIQQTISAVGR